MNKLFTPNLAIKCQLRSGPLSPYLSGFAELLVNQGS